MRVCVTHWRPATEILVSKITGTEYDLCEECQKAMESLLVETKKPEVPAARVDGRSKAARAKRKPKE
jgi:hypothetical protein